MKFYIAVIDSSDDVEYMISDAFGITVRCSVPGWLQRMTFSFMSVGRAASRNQINELLGIFI